MARLVAGLRFSPETMDSRIVRERKIISINQFRDSSREIDLNMSTPSNSVF